jgi:hypothetical protein
MKTLLWLSQDRRFDRIRLLRVGCFRPLPDTATDESSRHADHALSREPLQENRRNRLGHHLGTRYTRSLNVYVHERFYGVDWPALCCLGREVAQPASSGRRGKA